MKCPECGGNVKVDETRSSDFENIRRRICRKCGNVFYTSEIEINKSTGASLIREYKYGA